MELILGKRKNGLVLVIFHLNGGLSIEALSLYLPLKNKKDVT